MRKTEIFNVANLIENIIKKYENKNITSKLTKTIHMRWKKKFNPKMS